MVSRKSDEIKRNRPGIKGIKRRAANLSREEKMKMVPGLYKEGYTTRELAEMLRLSLTHIGEALKGATQKKLQETTKEPSEAIQAYKLFEREIPDLEVAKKLNIREEEVRQYKGEYWRLRGLEKLDELHKELGEGIWNLVSLYRRMRKEEMKPDVFVESLKSVQDLMVCCTNRWCQARIHWDGSDDYTVAMNAL